MYKPSKYNYYIENEDRVIYFNGLTGFLFPFKKEEHLKLQLLLEDCISFEINYPSICKKFKEWGFIVDDSFDEIDEIRLRNRLAVFDSKYYHLILNPTLECNFGCWYCYEKHLPSKMSNETMKRVKKLIDILVNKNKINRLDISWFGGEPLIYFDNIVYPLSLYAKEACSEIKYFCQITTNAFLITKSMIDKMKIMGVNSMQITIDGDEDTHNKIRNEKGIPSFNRIVNNIISICESIPSISIALRFNYTDNSLNEKMINILDKIPIQYRRNISPYFQRVWQTYKKNTTFFNNDKLLNIRNKCIKKGYNVSTINSIFKIGESHTCYMDRINTIMINYDSKIYTCTARDYSEKYTIGELHDNGEICWDNKKAAQKFGKAPFENIKCLECKHLPLCMGPCSQSMLDHSNLDNKDYCRLSVSEITPERFIIERYISMYH